MIPQVKKILYATDLSKNSSYAFQYALDVARRHEARIIILHSIEPGRFFLNPDLGGSPIVYDALDRMKEKEQEKDIERIKKDLRKIYRPHNAVVSKIIVHIGHPVEEILKAADDHRCDMIILGSHGKGFLKHTFLGSVVRSVLERTRKPVFVIPLPSEKTDIDWDKI